MDVPDLNEVVKVSHENVLLDALQESLSPSPLFSVPSLRSLYFDCISFCHSSLRMVLFKHKHSMAFGEFLEYIG